MFQNECFKSDVLTEISFLSSDESAWWKCSREGKRTAKTPKTPTEMYDILIDKWKPPKQTICLRPFHKDSRNFPTFWQIPTEMLKISCNKQRKFENSVSVSYVSRPSTSLITLSSCDDPTPRSHSVLPIIRCQCFQQEIWRDKKQVPKYIYNFLTSNVYHLRLISNFIFPGGGGRRCPFTNMPLATFYAYTNLMVHIGKKF